jgi:hypothetical protein
MTEEAQSEEQKNLLLEWKENEQELARQHAVAARMADVLSHVAGMLRSEPQKLIFAEESTPLQFVGSASVIVDTRGLDVGAIRGVRNAIRELEERQRDLRPRMVAFNLL